MKKNREAISQHHRHEPVVRHEAKIFAVGFFLIFLVLLWAIGRNWYGRELRHEEIKYADEIISEEISKAPAMTADELKKRLGEDIKLRIFDLRTQAEFNAGHIPSAEILACNSSCADEIQKIATNRGFEIILVDAGDVTGEIAKSVNELQGDGYRSAKYLAGGMNFWKSRAYPLVSTASVDSNSDYKVKSISLEDLKSQLSMFPDSIFMLDVRAKAEFDAGHIENAANIPLSELEFRHKELPAAKKIVLYGENNKDDQVACSILFDLNYFNVFRLDGGLVGWKKIAD